MDLLVTTINQKVWLILFGVRIHNLETKNPIPKAPPFTINPDDKTTKFSKTPPPSHQATIPPPVKVTEQQQQQKQAKKGFHYLFSVDCATHKATKYNYLSFMLFHSFIILYDEDSGHTLTGILFI